MTLCIVGEIFLGARHVTVRRRHQLRTSLHCINTFVVHVSFNCRYFEISSLPHNKLIDRYSSFTSDRVVKCRTSEREIASLNLGRRSHFAPGSTQPSVPPGSANHHRLLRRKASKYYKKVARKHLHKVGRSIHMDSSYINMVRS